MPFEISNDDRTLPNVLGEEALARLEGKIAEIDIEFHRAYQRFVDVGDIADENTETLIMEYASQRFFALANEALKSQSATTVVRRIIEDSLPVLIEKAFSTKHRSATSATSEYRKRFHDLAQFVITNSDEWLELQASIAERAKLEQETLVSLPKAEVIDFATIAEADVQNLGVAAPIPSTRRSRRGRPRTKDNLHPEVDVFLDDVTIVAKSVHNPHLELRRDITIRDFCHVTGFADDTFFGAWRSGNTERCPDAHARRFEHTLKLSPRQFLDRLSEHRR